MLETELRQLQRLRRRRGSVLPANREVTVSMDAWRSTAGRQRLCCGCDGQSTALRVSLVLTLLLTRKVSRRKAQ